MSVEFVGCVGGNNGFVVGLFFEFGGDFLYWCGEVGGDGNLGFFGVS